MFRELDQRISDGLTVTLEWEPDTGTVWISCEDHRIRKRSQCAMRLNRRTLGTRSFIPSPSRSRYRAETWPTRQGLIVPCG